MEIILVDWTRMGKTFCVAGLVAEGSGWRTVRPMPASLQGGPPQRPRLWGVIESLLSGPQKEAQLQPRPRNVGWFPDRLAQLQRWDIVELLQPRPAEVERPHTEDVWVRGLRPTGRSVPLDKRGDILRQTCVEGSKPFFGVPLLTTRTSAFLRPGMGERSLVTVVVPPQEILFDSSRREGADEMDVRVRLKVPGIGTKLLPVKDHFLLLHAEQTSAGDVAQLARVLRQTILQMGPTIAVRLGLSRGFDMGRGERRCWLMADGFFPAEGVQS